MIKKLFFCQFLLFLFPMTPAVLLLINRFSWFYYLVGKFSLAAGFCHSRGLELPLPVYTLRAAVVVSPDTAKPGLFAALHSRAAWKVDNKVWHFRVEIKQSKWHFDTTQVASNSQWAAVTASRRSPSTPEGILCPLICPDCGKKL